MAQNDRVRLHEVCSAYAKEVVLQGMFAKHSLFGPYTRHLTCTIAELSRRELLDHYDNKLPESRFAMGSLRLHVSIPISLS